MVVFNHNQVSGKLALVRVGDARAVLLPPLPAAPALELIEEVRIFVRNEDPTRALLKAPPLNWKAGFTDPTVNWQKLEKKSIEKLTFLHTLIFYTIIGMIIL